MNKFTSYVLSLLLIGKKQPVYYSHILFSLITSLIYTFPFFVNLVSVTDFLFILIYKYE